MQQAQVLDVGLPLRQRGLGKGIMSSPEDHRGEEILAVSVALEGAGLANERLDHVAVVDAMTAVATEAIGHEL